MVSNGTVDHLLQGATGWVIAISHNHVVTGTCLILPGYDPRSYYVVLEG
jgi:hypothetical protein